MAKGFKGSTKQGGGGMMGQLQKLQEQLQQAQERLAEETVEYTAGGGVIKIVMTGDQQCTAVVLDPALLQEDDIAMVQDLILTAINGALDASRKLATDRLGPLAGGLPF
jgi:DNA-binding YbaB/EbfC family protein